jgi:hypothetical protein
MSAYNDHIQVWPDREDHMVPPVVPPVGFEPTLCGV